MCETSRVQVEGGVDVSLPQENLWNGCRTAASGYHWNFAKLMWDPLSNFWLKGKIVVGQVTELMRHEKKNNLRPISHQSCVSNHIPIGCCHWLEWTHCAWFRSEGNHICPLTSHLDLSKVIRSYWVWPTPSLPIAAKLPVLKFLDVLRPNIWLIFHKIVVRTALLLPMSIRTIDPVFPPLIFFRWRWRCCHWGCGPLQNFDQRIATTRMKPIWNSVYNW